MGLICVFGAHGNLLDNPGFEGPVSTNAADDQSNWYTEQPDSTQASNWQQHSGSQALLVRGTWGGTPASGGFEQKVSVVAGSEYGLNFYYYWDNGFTSLQHDVVIEWLDDSDQVLESLRHEMDIGDPGVGWAFGGWHKFTDFALKAPAGSVRAEIRFEWSGISTYGTFYVDDVDFSDSVVVCYDEDFSVTGAGDYAFDFDYAWLSDFSATASQLELIWSGETGELGKETYSINQVGNAGILHSSGCYFLFAPAGATTLQVRVISLNLNDASNLLVSNTVLTEVSSNCRELKNNSFERPFNGSSLGNWVVAGTCERGTRVVLHGDAALQFSSSVGSVRQVVGVVEGNTYELVFQHVRDAGPMNRTNRVQVLWLTALEGGAVISNDDSDIGCPAEGSDWQRVMLGGLTAPAGAVAAEIFMESSASAGSAAYFVDDMFFREPANFFHRSTTNILDLAGNPFMIRGLALSGWFFPEAYMFGIDQGNGGHINSYTQIRNRFEEILGSEEQSELFWDAYTTNFLTEADVALVASKGVNTVRLPFNFRELSPENNEGAYRMKGFEQLDRVIEWCKNQGVYVILDMHSCPGGNAPVNSGDSEYVYYNSDWGKEAMKACLWRFDDDYNDMTGRTPESNVERTAAIWRFIAERYRNETQILGYELINEPFLDGSDDQVGPTYHINSTNFAGQVIRDAFVKVSDALREVDDRHLFFVEGDMFAEWCDNLMPRWDDNMAVAFHRYWKTNATDCLNDYIELRDTEQVPLWLSESGENSNPWCRELWELLEEHNIGYTWWTWKRMGGTYGGFIGELPSSFEYCIDNLWNAAVDDRLFEAGLFDTAAALNTEQCEEQSGYFAALFEPWFSTETRPFRSHVIPGLIHFVDYDVGNWSNAYYDTEYKSDSFWNPTDYNEGKVYRNDGVDIFTSSEGCGYVVEYVADNEWLKYTLDLKHPGIFDINVRVASDVDTAQLQLLLDGAPITPILDVPDSGGWSVYTDLNATTEIALSAGTHVLECRFPKGGVNISSVEFQLSESGYVDYDADDMDDHWEIACGGDLLPADDRDHDLMSNVQEYYADTDPTNGASRLCVDVSVNGSDLIVMVPISSTQRVYSVEYKMKLSDSQWIDLVSNRIGSGDGLTLMQTNSLNGYFRVKAGTP
ncbi:MAG: cellulase family glycosylhydrolase [Kiritimatiellae bacterium]|nr:cellulase family glycosylhydrolase [Kiritimatiellia bacterium]